MAELVDAYDSKSYGAIHAGSSPALGTIIIKLSPLLRAFLFFTERLEYMY